MAVTTVTELLDFFEAHSVEYLDMRFTDLRGTEHALTIPANTFTEASAVAGFAFDGSSIDGFTTTNEPDMILRPDISTAYIDPFRAHKTVNMKFFVHKSASDGTPYSRDPRSIARRAEELARHWHCRHLLYRVRGGIFRVRFRALFHFS